MKYLITLLLIIITLPIFASSHAKHEKNVVCEPRQPEIEYAEALIIAKNSLTKFAPIEEVFIDLIELKCHEQKHVWAIGFRRRAYESGHLLIYVYMDGATNTTLAKDG